MAKKKDLKDLGEVYSKLGEEVVVSEKNDMTVGDKDMTVGEAPLEDGGDKDAEVEAPEELKAEVAPDKKGDKKTPEEDEENILKDAQGGINNYMAKQSAFDTLFAKVISEDFGMDEQDDLNALGIEDATPDADLEGDDSEEDVAGEEVTVTLDKELAKTLCDLLQAAMGEEETDEAGDEDVADELELGEEDNEGQYSAQTTHVDMGTSNKVGSPQGLGGEGKGSADGGKSAGQTKLGDKHVGDQKVNAKLEAPTTKVTPKNKEVKAG